MFKNNGIYLTNEFRNIHTRRIFDVFYYSNKRKLYKIFYNIRFADQLNFFGFVSLFIYMIEDIEDYKKRYREILYKKSGSGVSLYDFCSYYKVDMSKIKKLLNKNFLTITEYNELKEFTFKEEVEKYFEILEKYSKEKLIVGCSNIFARQEGREGKEVVLKEKYKNKTVTFTTDEDLENFEIIKNKVKVINI